MTTIRLIIILCFISTTAFSQIDDPVDTAKFRGVKKEYQYRKDEWRPVKQISWTKEFDKNGRLVFQEIFVNNVDTPEFLNKYYYDQLGRIDHREYLGQTDDRKGYEVHMTRHYYYKDNKLYTIREYEFGRLKGKVLYKDTLNGQVGRFTYFNSDDTTLIWIDRVEFYNKNSKVTKAYRFGSQDTSFFYYDSKGRDSMSYHINIGKPHSIYRYFYKGNKKILRCQAILFPEDTYKETYVYNKKGDLKKARDNMGHKRNIQKFKYQKNGLKKLFFINSKYKIRQKGWTYYEYELY